jgi:Ca-activated chloride channel family protein
VAPGAAIAVEIEYQQVLRIDEGRYRLRVPTVVGPRYVPGTPVAAGVGGSGWSPDTDRVPDASRITPPVRRPSAGRINPLTVRVELAAGAPLARLDAPYHAVRVVAGADGRQRVELAGGPVPADRDFELVWEPAPGEAPAAAVFTERRGEEAFALLLVLPPSAATAGVRSRREVILVIDTSGSMHGASIGQAKAASAMALSRLTAADSFNVIEFNSRTRMLWPAARPATADNLAAADRFVGGLRAEGGTEMLPALTRALEGAAPEGRLRQVIFLTDGAVGNESALFAAIRERLGASRLFTVGIGSAPNSYFMRQAAVEGRGTFTYVGSPTEVGAKMSALFRKLEQPALTDVRLELSGHPAAGGRPAAPVDALPDPIPDVYAGEPVVIALRAGELPARAVLRGRRGGAEWQQELALGPALEHAGLATHWARQKIGALLEQRRPGAPESERAVRDAVLALALRHGLVSPYTSLVAVDVTPVRPADAALQTAAMETNLPEGWDYDAVFGMGQGATAAPVHLLAGLGALVLAALTLWLARRHVVRVAPALVPAAAAMRRTARAART